MDTTRQVADVAENKRVTSATDYLLSEVELPTRNTNNLPARLPVEFRSPVLAFPQHFVRLKGLTMQPPKVASCPTTNSGRLNSILSDAVDTQPVTPNPSPQLDWLLNPDKKASRGELGAGSVEETYDRILARLTQLETHEPEIYFQCDYRIAFLIVRFLQTGEAKYCTPQVLATYNVLGCHPDQVWTRIIQRRQAMLGQPISILSKKKSATGSGQVSPTTANTSEHAGTCTAFQERGIGPDSVPSPKSSDEEKSA